MNQMTLAVRPADKPPSSLREQRCVVPEKHHVGALWPLKSVRGVLFVVR